MAEWTNKKVLCLIRMYRDRPELWDPKNESYKDKIRRHQELSEMALALRESKEEVERKIKNLQCHFSRELRKEGKSSRCGTITSYKSKWFAYEAMMFLKDKQRPRKATSEEDELQLDDSSEEEFNIEDPLQIPIPKEQSDTKPQLSTRKLQTKKRKLEETLDLLVDEADSDKFPTDEFGLFGELVAIKLRRLPTDHSRIVVQHIINTALFDGYMGKYDNPGTFRTDWAPKSYPANSRDPPIESYTYSSQTSPMAALPSPTPGSRDSPSLLTTETEVPSLEPLDIKMCSQ